MTQLPILPLGDLTRSQLAGGWAHPTTPMPTSGSVRRAVEAALTIALQPNPHAAVHPIIKSYELRLFVTFADAAYRLLAGHHQCVAREHP